MIRVKKRKMKKSNFPVIKFGLLGLLTLVNVFNVSIGFGIWDQLSANQDGNVITIGTGTSVSFTQTTANFTNTNLLIAENMATRTSNDINTSINTTYEIELVNDVTNEVITPYMDAGTGETWFAEIKIGNVLIENNNVDVTSNGAGALRFRIDFIQNSQTTTGTNTVVSAFNAQSELVQSIEIIDNGTYIPTDFQVHLSIINEYTDAHSIALHGASVSYEIYLEITKVPESM